MFHGLWPENARRSEKAKLIKPQHLDRGGEGYVVTFAIQGPSRSVSFEASSGIYIFLSANRHQRDCNFDDVLSLDKM